MSLRLGLVGLDSPHAASFTRLINGFADQEPAIAKDAKVVIAWPGEASQDLPLSRDRIVAFTDEVARLGVSIVDHLDAVLTQADAFLILAVDVRQHPPLLDRLISTRKPIYIDTRFAPSVNEADRLIDAAQSAGVTLLGGSPKRFAKSFTEALVDVGRVTRLDLDGPLPQQPTYEGVAWYGVHMIDMAVAAFGPGCCKVHFRRGSREDFTLEWDDGRVATFGGIAEWRPVTRGTVQGNGGSRDFEVVANERMLVPLIESIVAACATGSTNIAPTQLRETVAIVEAANKARRTGSANVPA